MTNVKFYICKHCGKIIGIIKDPGVPTICCGEPMEELIPNTVDASKEKHVPVATLTGDVVSVEVGSAPHPMIPEHFIEWIYVQTEQGGQRKNLNPGEEPKKAFCLKEDKAVAVYIYCNLHGLWKTEL